MFEIRINSNKAWAVNRETLTRLGKNYDAVKIRLDLSSEWEDLSKIAVFRAQDSMIDVPVMGEYLDIPPVMLQRENVHLLFGLYGTNTNGAVVIPTIWTDLGIVQPSPDPYGADNYDDPPAGLYAQLQALAAAAQSAAATAVSGTYAASIGFSLNAAGHLIMSVTENGETTTTDLGTVTAYAAAVAGGYTGTYAEFQAMLQASQTAQTKAQQALDAASNVAGVAQQASQQAATALTNANSALTAANAASTAVAGKQDKVITHAISLAAGSEWENVSCVGATATNLIIYSPAPDSLEAAADAGVVMTAQGTDVVTFRASQATTEAIVMNVAIFP